MNGTARDGNLFVATFRNKKEARYTGTLHGTVHKKGVPIIHYYIRIGLINSEALLILEKCGQSCMRVPTHTCFHHGTVGEIFYLLSRFRGSDENNKRPDGAGIARTSLD